jgi:hypothetical protein
MTQNHFEINISRNGRHFFATHERSCKTEAEFLALVPILKLKFPESEGYEIQVSKIECWGKQPDKRLLNELEEIIEVTKAPKKTYHLNVGSGHPVVEAIRKMDPTAIIARNGSTGCVTHLGVETGLTAEDLKSIIGVQSVMG